MKTNLFFFSATGNTLQVAKDIATALPDTELFSIPRVIHQNIDCKANNLGILFPVFYGGMPRIVVDFLNKLKFQGNQYVFAVATYGGFPAGALRQVQKQLQAKEMRLKAGFTVKMPGNYIVRYGPIPEEKQRILFAAEEEKAKLIAAAVAKQAEMPVETSGAMINGLGSLFYKSMLPKFRTFDKNFTVDEKCTHCECCAKICPVGNITMSAGRPVWQNNCEHCLACIQWCPVAAIQYELTTKIRQRYHHPAITVSELYR